MVDVGVVTGGREARGPVGGVAAVLGEAVDAAFELVNVVEDLSVLAVSVLVVAGDAAVDRAARGDFGASPRSRWSIRAAALTLPRSRSRFAGDV